MKLIILNGSVGVGKSTLAKKLHEFLPASCLVNIDEQRKLLSFYRENKDKSRFLAHEIGLAIVEACLKNGVDVIIDKMMYNFVETGRDRNVLDIYRDLGKKYHADVYEFLLWADKKTIIKRLDARGYHAEGLLTPEKAETFWWEMEQFKQIRTLATTIDTSPLSAVAVFEKVKKTLS